MSTYNFNIRFEAVFIKAHWFSEVYLKDTKCSDLNKHMCVGLYTLTCIHMHTHIHACTNTFVSIHRIKYLVATAVCCN